MKKLIYVAIALAIVFTTSCSQNEVLEQVSGNPINFRNSYLTKATASGTFNVLGYKAPSGGSDVNFMTDTYTIGGAFGSGNTYYFDGEADSEYKFYAYALNAANALSTFTPASTSVVTAPPSITFETDATACQDLVIASDVTIKGDHTADAVTLPFKHALTKVRFTIQKAAGVGNKIDVTKIVYTVNNSNATFSLADGVASSLALGTKNIYTLTGDKPDITTTAVEFPDASTFLYVIPQTLTTGATLAVTYKVDGVEQTPVSFNLTNTLAQNKQVVYAITVDLSATSMNAISFSATVGDWEAETTSTL
jgi:Fimbrillin-like